MLEFIDWVFYTIISVGALSPSFVLAFVFFVWVMFLVITEK
jgi:hypothetical protein